MGIIRKMKGRNGTMPTEMLKEFIGKTCCIGMLGGFSDVTGMIVAAEENWIKVEEKKNLRIINADYIRDITIKKEN